jgi:hypothetical protein
MRMRSAAKVSVLSAAMTFVAVHQPVQAYIDPGSASYALQILTGGILGGLFLVKTYWGKLKDSLRRVARVRRSKG